MRYRKLGRTGLEVSELSLGAGPFKKDTGESREEAARIVRHALEHGINYFDTAPAYGESEKVLGYALHNAKEPFVVSTKLGDRPEPFDPRDSGALRQSVEESLRLLDRDSIDILFIHEPDRPGYHDWFTDRMLYHGPVTELLDRLKAEKIVRFTGLAGTTAYEMASLIERTDYDVVLTAFNYSLLWQEALFSVIPAAKKRGMGIIAGSPLQHGALARVYTDEIENGADWLSPPRRIQFKKLYALIRDLRIPIAELGLRYILSNDDIAAVLVGVNGLSELKQDLQAEERGPLSDSVLSEIGKIAGMVPFRPYEEPYKLPFNSNYRGPGHIGSLYGI